MAKKQDPLTRFAAMTDLQGQCIVWTGGLVGGKGGGYGKFWFEGTSWRAHCWFYHHYVEPLEANDVLCHTCNDRACVNPDHLYVGSHATNAADRRSYRGEGNPAAVLSSEDAESIRLMYKSGYRQVDIARLFGISQGQISRIVRGENWKGVIPMEV